MIMVTLCWKIAVIEPLSYIFVPVIGVLVLKEKISKRRILGIAIMFAGIVIFSM